MANTLHLRAVLHSSEQQAISKPSATRLRCATSVWVSSTQDKVAVLAGLCMTLEQVLMSVCHESADAAVQGCSARPPNFGLTRQLWQQMLPCCLCMHAQACCLEVQCQDFLGLKSTAVNAARETQEKVDKQIVKYTGILKNYKLAN